ncbi:MAG TPA: hypothetical protein DCF65_13800 [Chloroflexi bacterium]|jgi:hypothetical protein|nr:hypothetical protein [Chloroflexota bacterium]HAF18472.1 hypothetical protein [Chloroflexota bacterium]
MFNLKRSVLAAGFMAVAALASASVSAQAAGGGGGVGGIDALTISPDATLVAKLAVSVTVTYTCRPVFDPSTNTFVVIMSSSAFVSVQERTGNDVANGSGIANGTAVCDEGLAPTPTVNSITVLVQPTTFPTSSGPFKNGTALASTSVIACPNSFFPLPCDFGSAGPTVISIKS